MSFRLNYQSVLVQGKVSLHGYPLKITEIAAALECMSDHPLAKAVTEYFADVRTGEVSASSRRGKHTTTFSEMYPLEEGGYLIDTPGIKGFGLIDIADDEACRYFPDLLRHASGCAYYNCTHTHEPSCAVKEAVAQGLIAPSRYESYLKLLEDDKKYRK